MNHVWLGIVAQCFQSERSSDQSLQFLRPTHQNFNFISVSGHFGRIFLSVIHGENIVPLQEHRIDCKFQCQAAAKRSLCSIRSASRTTLAVWMPKKMQRIFVRLAVVSVFSSRVASVSSDLFRFDSKQSLVHFQAVHQTGPFIERIE